jgi:pimeloyl-ACP methyl ester carboxylesterase
MSWVVVGGVRLYYERRGDGPSVLFISGASGDAGHWTGVADVLATQYTVVTYDRRGNSRSPRPADWNTTTIEEQADDAAGLPEALDLAPATVFGTSAAAGILASVCVRHPEVLAGAIFHEPVFPSGASNIDTVRAARRARLEEGIAKGGLRLAMELFLRDVADDQVYESLDPQLRERLLDNGSVLYGIEIGPFVAYEPSRGELKAFGVPCLVTAGAANRDPTARGHWRFEVAQWLAGHLGTTVVELPGGHMAYLGEPEDFAEALRPLLHHLSRRQV